MKTIFNNLIGESRYDKLRIKAMHSVTKHQDFEAIKKSLEVALYGTTNN